MGRFIKYIGSPCSAMRRALSLLNQDDTPAYVPKLGDIIVHNSNTNEDKVVPYELWLQLEDSWDATGLYDIETIEEENTVGGEYVILSNGITFIINSADYSLISDYWEHVDTIPIPHDYVEIAGVKWATMNVGASSVTDYGNYYQYGKGAATLQETNGDTEYEGTEDPLAISADTVAQTWGGNWRTPTETELHSLIDNTDYTWENDFNGSGINGGKFTDKTDNSKFVFLPAAGYYNPYEGTITSEGGMGGYWSSTNYGSNATYFGFWNEENEFDTQGYNVGYPIRGILDE